LAIGGLNAVLWAVAVAAVALAWFGNPALAGVFSLAVVLNLLAGVFAGTVIPMGLERLGVDPALAGGVMLVALTDAFGFGVFLGLGSWLLL
jgi:magnesium transporter